MSIDLDKLKKPSIQLIAERKSLIESLAATLTIERLCESLQRAAGAVASREIASHESHLGWSGQQPHATHPLVRNFMPAPLPKSARIEMTLMTKKLKIGDSVTWNSEAGYVSGTIIKVHTRDAEYKGYVHHASTDDPQYEIKSSKTDHIAMHKGAALKKTSD